MLLSALVLSVVATLGQPAASSAHLIFEQKSVAPGVPFWVGVKIEPDDGCHSYWTNPGDSGLPLSIDWKLPAGWRAAPALAPVPETMVDDMGTSFGFAGPATYLVKIIPAKAAKGTVEIQASLRYMVCNTACVMQSATLKQKISVGRATLDPAAKTELDRARTALPKSLSGATFAREGATWVLMVPALGLPEGELRFLPERAGLSAPGAEQSPQRTPSVVTIRFPASEGAPKVAKLTGVLIVGGKGFLIEAKPR